jgi:hypothetical protein
MNLISGDLEDFDGGGNIVSPCMVDFSGSEIASCGYVDDLIISYSVVPIDGPGKVLGSAGPQRIRNSQFNPGRNLPVSGFMEFDSADWASMQSRGLIEAVVLHE